MRQERQQAKIFEKFKKIGLDFFHGLSVNAGVQNQINIGFFMKSAKGPDHRSNKALSALLALVVASACAVNFSTNAADVVLTSGNSSAIVSPTSSAGMYNWTVDNLNQLNRQWFWYRLGGVGPEATIDTIGAPVVAHPSASVLGATYYGNGFNLSINYELLGGLPGDGNSDITETITVNNTSGNPLDFHFFQFSDFNLNIPGVSGPDSVTISDDGFGGFYRALQTKGTIGISETIDTPSANHAMAGDPSSILALLNDGSATTLNGPLTYTGDAAWALQWDVTIGAGDSLIVLKDKKITIGPIPEPSSLALIGLGLAGFIIRRRRG